MQKIYLFILIIGVFIALHGCESDNSLKNKSPAYQAGYYHGDQEGFDRGRKYGYDSGYADGLKKSNKDVTVDNSVISEVNTTLKIFGITISWLLLLLSIGVIALCFYKENNRPILIAKTITLVLAIICGYGSFLVIDLNSILYLRIQGVWGILINISLAFFSFLIIKYLYRLVAQRIVFVTIAVIGIVTVFTCYFCLFLTNIDLYIIENHFIVGSIFSILLGGSVFSIYKLVDSQLTQVKHN